MANIIFWRHAEAEEYSESGADRDRALTKKGRKDARKMAKWLSEHLPENAKVFCSPAKRCQETAAALSKFSTLDINVVGFLNTDSTVEIITQKLINEEDDINTTFLIVGHQPTLGQLIAKRLGMQQNACVVKKGTVWWLRQREDDEGLENYLFTVQHPDL
jgi:phosphohistidine phosphatase